jgi:hypothetical protein
MQRPTFFLSSTIYDFRDLRSAIKFYLEEQGCKVLASEFNDFEKPLDEHSYNACLCSIHAADYFVLLIGSRVGGWYDEPNRISITQREYREAYNLHRSGKLKILAFVRSEVWQVKEDRRELEKYLRTTTIDEPLRHAISNYPSKFAADAVFLTDFLSEVGKNNETKFAVQGKAVAPSGNWVHVISGFRDVADVLQAQVFSSIPVEDMTARRLLRRELRDFVAQCAIKISGKLYAPRDTIEQFHAEHPVTLEGKKNEFTTVSTKRWGMLSFIAMRLLARQFHPVVLPQVLSCATFLEFNVQSTSYKETPIYEALLRLQDEIRRFNFSNKSETLSVIFKYSPRAMGNQSTSIDIETTELAGLLHLLDRWSNVLDISTSVLKHLDGEPFKLPSLRPDSPIQGMQEMLEEEKITDEEVSAFVAAYAHQDRY